jgi:hypothetical protein
MINTDRLITLARRMRARKDDFSLPMPDRDRAAETLRDCVRDLKVRGLFYDFENDRFTTRSSEIVEVRDIHACDYYCVRPECVLAQRNALRDAVQMGKE